MFQESILGRSEIEEPLIWEVTVAACESFKAIATYLPLIFLQSLGGINTHFGGYDFHQVSIERSGQDPIFSSFYSNNYYKQA